jgi:hypothetical protein
MFRILGHLIVTAVRAFWRLLTTAILFAALGAAAMALLLAQYTGDWHWPPTQVMVVALVAGAVLAGYAAGITVLMIEAVRALKGAVTVAEQEAVAPIKAVERELEGSPH